MTDHDRCIRVINDLLWYAKHPSSGRTTSAFAADIIRAETLLKELEDAETKG